MLITITSVNIEIMVNCKKQVSRQSNLHKQPNYLYLQHLRTQIA